MTIQKIQVSDFLTAIKRDLFKCSVLVQDIDEDCLSRLDTVADAERASAKAEIVTEILGNMGDTLNTMQGILDQCIIISMEGRADDGKE